MDPAGDGAEFHIPTVGHQHAGSYSCSYRNRSEPFVSSQPSDPLWLVVAGPPAPLCLISNISTAAVVLLLLLLVAFVCFIKTRARKGAALRPSSPLGVLKAPAQEDPIYDSIDEGEQPQTLEPGIYAELDRQTLQPSVYDVINVSWGAPQ
ncbi:killer cell immunoglobulin-like receptor 3DL1 [Chrysemys picta bellii]|uniref:killer cell immunoglobulin-like receptor 3DL1 n=1 Tax=Chrysemys picta bellii TaxID=8478 RepID=UPI0032B1105D